MNDEVTSKIIAVEVEAGKLTARQLENALREVIRKLDQETAAAGKSRKREAPTGKQSLASLKRQNVELTNIEVTEKNIKSFERYARKYGIDYALKKDKQSGRYYVFFKGRDVDTMKAAFKEYTAYSLGKEKKPEKKKPSLIQNLHKKMEKAAKEAARTKNRTHEQSR